MSDWKPYHEFDLNTRGLLPIGWQEDVLKVVELHGVDTILDGQGSTSREEKAVSLPVRVVDGIGVRDRLPWLHELYNNELRELSGTVFKRQLYVANLIKSSVNINYLCHAGKGYEWHVDSNPVTGLLFVSDGTSNSGGELVFKNNSGKECYIIPKAGIYICFDARDIPHSVRPLNRGTIRVSAPMNYYFSAADQERPSDLDEQIYTERG